MKSLNDVHTKFCHLHILQLMRELFNITMKPHETVQSFLAKLIDLDRKLANGSPTFTDRKIVLVMFLGLPKNMPKELSEKAEMNQKRNIVLAVVNGVIFHRIVKKSTIKIKTVPNLQLILRRILHSRLMMKTQEKQACSF